MVIVLKPCYFYFITLLHVINKNLKINEKEEKVNIVYLAKTRTNNQ